MLVTFNFEASKPSGTTYRFGLRWYFPLTMLSVLTGLLR